MKALDLTGMVFGRLTVLRRNGSLHCQSAWECLCECGKKLTTCRSSLKTGATSSCGCLRSEQVSERQKTHGLSRNQRMRLPPHPLYKTWVAMRNRCNNSRDVQYKDYGGRGIKICERWNDFPSFLADVGVRPVGTTLDRKNNNGHYEPGNVRWATKLTQVRNRRNTRPDFIYHAWNLLRTGDLSEHTTAPLRGYHG